jgi:hypothetical protein
VLDYLFEVFFRIARLVVCANMRLFYECSIFCAPFLLMELVRTFPRQREALAAQGGLRVLALLLMSARLCANGAAFQNECLSVKEETLHR